MLFADADVLEAVRGSLAFRVQVAAVNQQRVRDILCKGIPVQMPKLFPFGEDEDRIGLLGGLVMAQAVGYVRQFVLCLLHCLRVVGANFRTLGKEPLNNVQCRGETNVVSVWLECQTPDGNGLAAQNPELLLYLRDKLLRTAQIDFLHFLQQGEIASELFPDANEGLKIFGEAKAAETDPGIQETLPDTPVAANALCYFGNVGASGLAGIRYQIDERNLHGQE